MNETVPYTNVITGTLDVISQSLTIPVLIILLLMVVVIAIIVGMVISEYTSRKKVPVEVVNELIFNINDSNSVDELEQVIMKSELRN